MNTLEAISKRRTIRKFTQKKVSEKEIIQLIEAARLASCGGNMQRLRFTVINSEELVKEVFDCTAWAAFVKPNRSPEWGKNAPLTFILLTAPLQSGNVIHADAGAAIENMQLCAVETGLGCCWIGSFSKEKVREILSIPKHKDLIYLLAVGYPDESPVQEDITAADSPKYYLDDKDRLHVPKFSVEALTEWK